MAMVPSSRPLYLVCTWKEVCNLLNRILCRRHVVARKEGWIWDKTRSMVDSGGLCVLCMVSTTNIFTTSDRNHRSLYPLMPLWPFSLQRDVSIELVSTRDRDFSGFLPVDMRGIRGWIPSPVFCVQQQIIFIMHSRAWSYITWNNECFPKHLGVVVMPKQHPTNIKPGFRMLALSVWRGRVHLKTLESFLLSQIPILKNIQINTQLENSTKSRLEIFSNKYKNKLENIWRTAEKESTHLELYFKRYDQSKIGQNLILYKIWKRKTVRWWIRFPELKTYSQKIRLQTENALCQKNTFGKGRRTFRFTPSVI